jgi:hypothetical protein
VHGDVGIVNVLTFDGYKYYSLLKDDASEYTDVKLLKKKNEAAIHVVEFCQMIKTQTGRPVKSIRTDQGTEYEGEQFNNWKRESGVIHQTSCRYTPQQNGVSERGNRTLIEGVRSSLYDVNPNNIVNSSKNIQFLWGEFLRAAAHIRNRVVTSKNIITPYEKFFGKTPNVEYFRILGCEAKILIPDNLRKKLDPTCVSGWFVGYPENVKGWKVWVPTEGKVVISRDVKFDETKFIGDVATPGTGTAHNPCEPFTILMNAVPHCSEQYQDIEQQPLLVEGTFAKFFFLN